MKVLCFGRFYDDIPGGMQRHIEHLFAAMGPEVEYVHLVPSRDRRRAQFQLHGFPVVRTRSFNLDGSVALSPGLIVEAWRQQREHHFDLVHLHFPDPMSHLASLAIPASVPRVISWHADIVRHKSLLQLYRPFMRRALAGAEVIVATPHHIDSSPDLQPLAGAPNLHVIPYGFDLTRFTTPAPGAEALRAKFGGRPQIFALGRHVYYKGFDVLIRAMAAIRSDAVLVIGGVGPLTEQWREIARAAGVEDRVHFAGLIGEDELPAYYQACELFCLPATSNAEAFGIVQVEAMAAGRPVVSTSLSSGVSYVNQHETTGLQVAPDDSLALAAAINRLLGDNALRARLGVNARARALEEFSEAAMARRTLQVYQAAIATARTATV